MTPFEMHLLAAAFLYPTVCGLCFTPDQLRHITDLAHQLSKLPPERYVVEYAGSA